MYGNNQNFNNNQNGIFNQNNSLQSSPNNYNINEGVENDIPPELGEIQNLSDATVATAPTMDVLAPMNVMPTTLPSNNDPLDAYDNGTRGFDNQMIQNNTIQNNNYQPQVPQSPVMINPQAGGYFNEQNNSFPDQNNFGAPNSLNTSYNVQMPLDTNINNTIQPQVNNFNPDYLGTFNQPTQVTNQETIVPSQPINSGFNDVTSNFLNSEKRELSNDALKEESLETTMPDEKEYEVENTSLKEQEEKETDEVKEAQEDLGLDESYNEPDSLEIMDLDSETVEDNIPAEENSTEDDSSSDSGVQENTLNPGDISKGAQKIKDLIEEMKKSGYDIKLEEFDFEEMYQLIIKINK